MKGSIIEIVSERGIALRHEPDEPRTTDEIDQLPKGMRLTVEEVVTKGTENRLYLKVTSGSKSGWIYAGRTFPDVTVSTWIKLWN